MIYPCEGHEEYDKYFETSREIWEGQTGKVRVRKTSDKPKPFVVSTAGV